MRNVLQAIARENFRSSGYITHVGGERRKPWTFTNPPKSPFLITDTVSVALQRRENALLRQRPKTSLIKNCLNVILHR